MGQFTQNNLFFDAEQQICNMLLSSDLSSIQVLPENTRDIENEITKALGKQGVVAIVYHTQADFQGILSGVNTVFQSEIEVKVIENVITNRSSSNKSFIGTSQDIAVKVTNVLGAQYGRDQTFQLVDVKTEEDSGFLVTTVRYKVMLADELSGVVEPKTGRYIPFATRPELEALSADVSALSQEWKEISANLSLSSIQTANSKVDANGTKWHLTELSTWQSDGNFALSNDVAANFQPIGNYVSATALLNYYKKNETSSATQLATALAKKLSLTGGALSGNVSFQNGNKFYTVGFQNAYNAIESNSGTLPEDEYFTYVDDGSVIVGWTTDGDDAGEATVITESSISYFIQDRKTDKWSLKSAFATQEWVKDELADDYYNKKQVDAAISGKVSLSGDSMSGALSVPKLNVVASESFDRVQLTTEGVFVKNAEEEVTMNAQGFDKYDNDYGTHHILVFPSNSETTDLTDTIAVERDIPISVSQLSNDSGYLTSADAYLKSETSSATQIQTEMVKYLPLSGGIVTTGGRYSINTSITPGKIQFYNTGMIGATSLEITGSKVQYSQSSKHEDELRSDLSNGNYSSFEFVKNRDVTLSEALSAVHQNAVADANAGLSNYYLKTETSSANQLSAAFENVKGVKDLSAEIDKLEVELYGGDKNKSVVAAIKLKRLWEQLNAYSSALSLELLSGDLSVQTMVQRTQDIYDIYGLSCQPLSSMSALYAAVHDVGTATDLSTTFNLSFKQAFYDLVGDVTSHENALAQLSAYEASTRNLIPVNVSDLSNDVHYTTWSGVRRYAYRKSETSSAIELSEAFANIQLSDVYKKNETSSASEISTALGNIGALDDLSAGVMYLSSEVSCKIDALSATSIARKEVADFQAQLSTIAPLSSDCSMQELLTAVNTIIAALKAQIIHS